MSILFLLFWMPGDSKQIFLTRVDFGSGVTKKKAFFEDFIQIQDENIVVKISHFPNYKT